MGYANNYEKPNGVEIPVERFAELVLAESEAKALEKILREKCEHYSGMTYAEVEMLCKLYNIEPKKQDEE